MVVKKVIKNGVIKYVRVEEDNQSEPLTEEDHSKKDLEIRRLEAIIDILTKELEKQPKPKEEEAPSSDVMAVASASSYDCYS